MTEILYVPTLVGRGEWGSEALDLKGELKGASIGLTSTSNDSGT